MEVGEMSNKEEPQVEVPWIPTTPVKPILQKPVPIYSSGEGNHLPHHVNGAVACPEFITVADKNSMPHDGSLPEATVAKIADDIGQICAETDYDSVPPGFGHTTFSELIYQAEKGTLNPNATQPGSNGLKNPFIPSLMSLSNGDPVANPANAALSHHHHHFLESKIIQGSSQDPQGTSHIACWSGRTSQDSPFTPDSAGRSESRQVVSMQINTEEKNPGAEEKNVRAEKLNNNETTFNKELCDPVVEFGTVSTPFEENHPDTGSSLVIDLNKTPQQKPRTRRRKHRPKVITEGKPKRARKPITQKNVQSKENPPAKRKYVRKKGVNKISTTPAEESPELIKDLMTDSTKRSCRKSLNFDIGARDESSAGRENATAHLGKDGVIVQETNVDLACDLTTSMQQASYNYMPLSEATQAPSTTPSRKIPPGAKPKENPTAKRKYARRKASDKSSIPPTEVTGSSLNFGIGASNENPVGRENVTVNLSKEIGVVTQEANVGLPCDLNTSMEQASNNNTPLPEEVQDPSKGSPLQAHPKDKATSKRKYERKKRVVKSSAPPTEITEGLNEPLKPGSRKRSRRKSLNFDVRARDESSVGGENLNVCIGKEPSVVAEEVHAKLAHDQSTFYISLHVEMQASTTSPSKGNSPGTKPKEKTTGKRYARRKRLKTSALTAELTEALMPESTETSCRRYLNFDVGARNESSMGRENFNVHISKENGVLVKETHMGLARDQNTSVMQTAYKYKSLPEDTKAPSISPSKSNSPREKLNANTNFVENKNKRNGHAAAQDGHENSANILSKSVAQINPKSSVSQMAGSKRNHSGFPKHPDIGDINLIGTQHNALASYQTQYNESHWGTVQLRCPQEDARGHPYASNSNHCTSNSQQNTQTYEEFVFILRQMMMRSPTPICDCTSLTRIRNCCTEPNYSAKQGISDRQTFEAAERPLTCIDATVAEMGASLTRKKRSRKKSALSSPADSSTNEMQQHHNVGLGSYQLPLGTSLGIAHGIIWETMHYIDALAERFRQLTMNREARDIASHEQNALVAYKHQNIVADGTIIPFQGPFDPIKKHRRPKVDLDEETDRVWKLLMIDINSHGIDGTNEEKAKWWEEERNVFQGRADSFIARMHLVQGDRRFSRWKGSVVDSVVGVFLTQNVSDHLSSSAFMSLAARFPQKSSSTCKTYNGEGTSLIVKEPQVHMVEPEENTEWDLKTLNQPVYDQSSTTIHMVEHSGEKEAVNSSDSGRAASSVTSLMDESNGRLSESSQRKTEEREEKSCYEGVRTNEIVSSQIFVISSQVSGDLLSDQNPEKIGSCSDSNSEVEDLSSTTKDNSIHNCIPHEYTLKLTPDSGGLEASCFDPFKTEASSSGFLKNKDKNDNRPCFQRSVSASQVVISNSQEQSNHTQQSFFNISGQTEDLMQKERQLDLCDHKDAVRNEINEVSSTPKKLKSTGQRQVKNDDFNWDSLRIKAQAKAGKREKTENTMDSLDWDAVRRADVSEISDVIKERGMNNRLAERIKNFLNRLVEDHGDIDLEWLRDVAPDQAKEYLLSIRGLGLKSVECVRLLTLHHLAFPVDTNVGRIAVRLGWVPLQPLPESLQLHLLELYPVLESIQKYLWPRLCKLDQRTLYELHYQMITFGKVFCTKSKPNCNACPMRGECRHFASAFASARLALPGPEQRSIVSTSENNVTDQNPSVIINQLHLPPPENASQGAEIQQTEVSRQLELKSEIEICHPIIEEPTTPEPECSQVSQIDMEDAFIEDSCEIPTIKLNMEEFTLNLQNYIQESMELQEGEMSKALVALNPEVASIPTPKLKNVSRLRTEHCVYELPDTHPLLEGWERREPDDPGKYLLAIWTPGETANSIQPPESKCSSQECGQLCNEKECFSCNSFREANSQIVRGTILIPCRTAMRGSFPLNGTYFQVNEVFAEHDSSLNPISVPRSWIWNLNRRTVYFGTSMPTIFKGLSTQEIQQCFWRGYVCVRGFDRATRAPRPLMARLHFPASKLPKTKENTRRKKSTAAKSQGPEPNPGQAELLIAAKSQLPEPNPEHPELLIAAKSQGQEPNPEQPKLLTVQEPNPDHPELLSHGHNVQ